MSSAARSSVTMDVRRENTGVGSKDLMPNDSRIIDHFRLILPLRVKNVPEMLFIYPEV
jgi:hypothetical protein